MGLDVNESGSVGSEGGVQAKESLIKKGWGKRRLEKVLEDKRKRERRKKV